MQEHQWINWSKPILLEAVKWLFDQAESGDDEVVELGDFFCVVPGKRAKRMLLAVLVEKCQGLGKRLNAPDIHTPSTMVDELLPNRRGPAATECERVLAWMQALKRTSDDERSALLPHPPALGSFLEWHYLAKHLVELHQELVEQIDAADSNKKDKELSNVFTRVAEAASLRQLDAETLRWISIGKVYDQYLLALKEADLVDPFEARWEAIRKADSRPDIRIVLIGVVDLNQMQRSTLLNAATGLEILIHAPEDIKDRFDELGCLIPSEWEKAILPIEDERIIVVDRAADQAQTILAEIAKLDGTKSPQQITIGLGDESLAQTILQAGKWAGVGLHWAKGEPLYKSAPYRLLEAATAWLKEPRFTHLASMLRHSDLEHWLIAKNKTSKDSTIHAIENWQTFLDDYFTQYLQEQFTGDWLGSNDQSKQLKAVYHAICNLMAPLNDADDKPLGNWCSSVLEVLRTVYSVNNDDYANEALIEACSNIRDVCNEIASSKKRLQEIVDGPTAISFVLSQVMTKCITPDPQRNDIEMLGWLELHFDLADILIVAGFNEGFIPDAVTADAFLPDTLRRELDIQNNARRYARDAYYLQAMLNSRQQMLIVLGHRTNEGEPLTPSRLLMACEDSQLAKRVSQLTASKDKPVKHRPWGLDPPGKHSQFTVAQLPDDLKIPDAMRVTWFRDYLHCPYRFALNRLVKLKSKVDNAVELDAMQFGTLAHDVLCSFGQDESLIDCEDEVQIATVLCDTLSTIAKERYGSSLLPAVRVQLSRMRQRLKQFALVQSKLRKQGWRICKCEFDLTDQCTLDIPGENPILIKGRIDRIDQYKEEDKYRLIDYKTGDSAKKPTSAHKVKGKNCYGEDWVDVQLPLYGHLMNDCGFPGEIELAYINLPKDPSAVNLYPADWVASDLDDALETARRVVSDIRKCNFELNLNYHPSFDEFARICQTTTYASINSATEGS